MPKMIKSPAYYDLNVNFRTHNPKIADPVLRAATYSTGSLVAWIRMETPAPVDKAQYELSPIWNASPTQSTPFVFQSLVGDKYYPAVRIDGSPTYPVPDNFARVPDPNGHLSMSSVASGEDPTSTSDLSFTLSMWFKAEASDGNTQYVLVKGVDDPLDWEYAVWFFSDTGKILFYLYSDGDPLKFAYVATAELEEAAVSRWSHLAFTYDGRADTDAADGMKIYYNGTDVSNTRSTAGTYVGMRPEYGNNLTLGAAGGIGGAEGPFLLAEVAIWKNRELTPEAIRAVYTATKYGMNNAASGYLNNPPRTTLHTRDNATGSYPTMARTTGFPNSTGIYSSSFDDTNTVLFTEDRAQVNVQFNNLPKDGQTITVKNADNASTTFEIQFGVITQPGNVEVDFKYPNLDYNKPGSSWKSRKKDYKLKHAQLMEQAADILAGAVNRGSYGFSALANYNTVTLMQNKPGTAGNTTITNFMSGTQMMNLNMSGVYGFSGGSSAQVSYPMLLQPSHITMLTSSHRMPAGMIASPNANTDLTTTAVVRKGVADAGLTFTKGQDFAPFIESRINPMRPLDEFYAVGTPETVVPGFSTPLWSKTQVVVDINPVVSTSVFFSTGADPSMASTTSYNPRKGINSSLAYYNFGSSQWNIIGDLSTGSNVDTIRFQEGTDVRAGVAYTTQKAISGSYLPFMPPDWGGDPTRGGISNQDAMVRRDNIVSQSFGDSFKWVGEPISTFGFPYARQYHATSSQLLDMSKYITAPFMLEKVVIEFSASFPPQYSMGVQGCMDTSTASPNVGNYYTFGPDQNIFFLMNQFASASVETDKTEETYYAPLSIAAWQDTTSSIRFPGATYRDLITYGSVVTLPNENASGNPITLEDYEALNPWFLKDLNILTDKQYSGLVPEPSDSPPANTPSSAEDAWTMYTAGATGSFELNLPLRSPAKAKDFGVVHGWKHAKSGLWAAAFDWTSTRSTYQRSLITCGWGKGSRNGLGEASGRSMVGSIPGIVGDSKKFSTSGSSDLNESVVALQFPKKVSSDAPYLLLPTDKLVLGFNRPRPAAKTSLWGYSGKHQVAVEDEGFNDEAAMFRQRTELMPGVGKLTLYGSLLRDGKEYHDGLNQHLTSDALHLALQPDSPTLDQFVVEPRQSYGGGYLANVISGSFDIRKPVLGRYAPGTDPYSTNVNNTVGQALALTPSIISQVGLPRMRVGSKVTSRFDMAGRLDPFGKKAVGSITIEVAATLTSSTDEIMYFTFFDMDGNTVVVVYAGNAGGESYIYEATKLATAPRFIKYHGFSPEYVQLVITVPTTILNGANAEVAYRIGQFIIDARDGVYGADVSQFDIDVVQPISLVGITPTLVLRQTRTGPMPSVNPQTGVSPPKGQGLSEIHVYGPLPMSVPVDFNGGEYGVSHRPQSLFRGVRVTDEEEILFDSTAPKAMDYYMTNGAWVYDGAAFAGGGGHSSGNGRGSMRIMATKGGLKGAGGGDSAYAWDTVWAGAFPFEPRYRKLKRITNPLANPVRNTTGKSYNGSGEGQAYPVNIFVSSAYGDPLIVASSSMGDYADARPHKPWAPAGGSQGYPLTSSLLGNAFTQIQAGNASGYSMALVQKWFFGAGTGPAGMPALSLYQNTALTGTMDSNWPNSPDTPQPYITNEADPTPNVRGWKYGLANAFPIRSSAVFRENCYGQFRDMLEPRAQTKFYRRSAPITCRFFDRETGRSTTPTETHSQNLSRYATSSLPFFDAFRVRESGDGDSFTVGGKWTYGRDRDNDPDVVSAVVIDTVTIA